MKLRDILQGKGGGPICVDRAATVDDAIQKMNANSVGSVLICADDGSPSGIFTERDVLRLLAERGDEARKLEVAGVMTCDLVVAQPDSNLDETLAVITQHRCRHIPVVEDGRVIGMVSIGDLVKSKLAEATYEVESLRDYINTTY